MMRRFSRMLLLVFCTILFVQAQNEFESDTIKTSAGDLVFTFVGHGTLLFTYNNLAIHIDPVGQYADYSKMPAADIILITHQHGDHLDTQAVGQIKTGNTKIIYTEVCQKQMPGGTVMRNGETITVNGIMIEAIPAYNLKHKRDNGLPFHPKGEGNGYVLTFGNVRVYVAGDTENIPEMAHLKNIDYAFLPMNLPYTMTPQMVADAATAFQPKVLYPYHYGYTNVQDLVSLLKDQKDIEVRVRKLR